jgi:hypothetical protein
MNGTRISIFDYSLVRSDGADREQIGSLTIGLPDGEIQTFTFSGKDIAFLKRQLGSSDLDLAGINGKAKGEDYSVPSDTPAFTSPSFDPSPRAKRFVSDLRPSGLTLRKWVDGKLQVYSILGGYALPQPGHYMLLCRHGARPKRDFNLLVILEQGKLTTAVADDHPVALRKQLYMWRWFENWSFRKTVHYGNPPVNVKRLSPTALKQLIGKQK